MYYFKLIATIRAFCFDNSRPWFSFNRYARTRKCHFLETVNKSISAITRNMPKKKSGKKK